jgi:hypothetical protein
MAATAAGVTVSTSADYASAGAASVALGGQVTGVSLTIAGADRVPGATGKSVTITFTTATTLATGGTITVSYPNGFLASGVTPSIVPAAVIGSSGATGANAVVLTVGNSGIPAGSVLNLILGGLTIGGPMAATAAGVTVSTSADYASATASVTPTTSSLVQVNILCISFPCPSAFILSFGINVVVPKSTTCQCINCQSQSQASLVLIPSPTSFGINGPNSLIGTQSFSSFMVSDGSVFPVAMNASFSCLFRTGANQQGPTSLIISQRAFVPLGNSLYFGAQVFTADQQQLVPASPLKPSSGYATFAISASTNSVLTPMLTFSDIVWTSMSSNVTAIGIYSLSADLSTRGPLFYAVCGPSPAPACTNGASASFTGFQLPTVPSNTLYNSMLTGSPVYYLSFSTANKPSGEIGSVLLASTNNPGGSGYSMFPSTLKPERLCLSLAAHFSGDRITSLGYLNPSSFSNQQSNSYSQLLAPQAAVNVSINVVTNPLIPFSSYSSCQTSVTLDFPQNSFQIGVPGPLSSFNSGLSDSNTISITLNAPVSPGFVNIVLPANSFKLNNVVAALSVGSSGNSPSSSSPPSPLLSIPPLPSLSRSLSLSTIRISSASVCRKLASRYT